MLWFQLRSTTHGLDEAKPTPQCMLRGWLRAPLPGPSQPAWEGASARAGDRAQRGAGGAGDGGGRRTRAASGGPGWRGPGALRGSGGRRPPWPRPLAAALCVGAWRRPRDVIAPLGRATEAGESHLPRALPPAPHLASALPASARGQRQGWVPAGALGAGGRGRCDCGWAEPAAAALGSARSSRRRRARRARDSPALSRRPETSGEGSLRSGVSGHRETSALVA